MTQEDKDLLLKDLCAKLPYGVHVRIEASLETGKDGYDGPLESIDFGYNIFNGYSVMPESVKPYLRPMSSMTKEEKEEYNTLVFDYEYDDYWYPGKYVDAIGVDMVDELIDFYNKYHFDYRGLIPMGLALPAPEGMYEF